MSEERQALEVKKEIQAIATRHARGISKKKKKREPEPFKLGTITKVVMGKFARFRIGTRVKVRETSAGILIVERETWIGNLDIVNKIYGIPGGSLELDKQTQKSRKKS